MEPYYESWQESQPQRRLLHRVPLPARLRREGPRQDAGPGAIGQVRHRQRRAPPGRRNPRRELPPLRLPRDAAALRPFEFEGIPFDHAPHLEQLRRGKQLRCTSCHSQIVQGEHMTVTASPRASSATSRTSISTRAWAPAPAATRSPRRKFDLGGGVKFTHELAYERGVELRKCHGDLIRGNGEVPRERCRVCHNREDDLKRIDDHDFMHEKHVSEHKIDCLSTATWRSSTRWTSRGRPRRRRLCRRATPTTTRSRSTCSKGSEPSPSPRNPAA